MKHLPKSIFNIHLLPLKQTNKKQKKYCSDQAKAYNQNIRNYKYHKNTIIMPTAKNLTRPEEVNKTDSSIQILTKPDEETITSNGT